MTNDVHSIPAAEQSRHPASYINRFIRLLLGLFLYALGSYLTIQANIGLAPWEAFSMGVSVVTGTAYGNVVTLTGFVILLVDLLMKEKIGFGTILDMLIIGKCVDLLRWLNWVPMMQGFVPGLLLLLAGEISLCIGSYFYIGSGFSCGPRDALMVALGKRFVRAPIGLIRGLIEGSVLLIGWMLGAKVGVGTVISVFGIGFILQFTFKLLRFDVKSVEQEDVLQTLRGVRLCKKKSGGCAE